MVHISFGAMGQIQSLPQFLFNSLSQPVMPSHVAILRWFAAFAYYPYFNPFRIFTTSVSRIFFFTWIWIKAKSPQFSWILLIVLAGLINAVVWKVSNVGLVYKSSSPFTNPLGIVPSVPIAIGITVIFMFHSPFSSLVRCRHLSLCSLSFILVFYSTRSILSLTISSSGHLAEIVSQNKYNLSIFLFFSCTLWVIV